MRADLQCQQKVQGQQGLGLLDSQDNPASRRRERRSVVEVEDGRREGGMG